MTKDALLRHSLDPIAEVYVTKEALLRHSLNSDFHQMFDEAYEHCQKFWVFAVFEKSDVDDVVV